MTVVGRVAELWRYPVKSMAGQQLARTTLTTRGIPGDRGWALRDEQAGEIRGGKKMPVLMRCSAHYDEEPTDGRIPDATITLPDGTTVRTSSADVHERLSALIGRRVTLWPLQPAENRDHYRRGRPDHADLETELREVLGRLPDEPLPDFSGIPPELFEYASPPGSYFDFAAVHLLTSASLRALSARNPGAQFDRRRFRPTIFVEPTNATSEPVEIGWCGRRLRVGEAVIAISIPTMRCSMTMRPVDELPADASVLRTIVREANQNLGVYANVEEPGTVRVGDLIELL